MCTSRLPAHIKRHELMHIGWYDHDGSAEIVSIVAKTANAKNLVGRSAISLVKRYHHLNSLTVTVNLCGLSRAVHFGRIMQTLTTAFNSPPHSGSSLILASKHILAAPQPNLVLRYQRILQHVPSCRLLAEG